MKKTTFLFVALCIFFTKNSISQFSVKLNHNYMTNNYEAINWGFTIHPEYNFSHQWCVGISTSFFLNPNPFPDYQLYADAYNTPNVLAGTTHRILPIDATIKYYFNKNYKQKLQPYFQLNTGAVIIGTFAKAEVKNIAYAKETHEKEINFSVGFKIGSDYSLSKHIVLNFDGGYARVFSNNTNRFSSSPVDLTAYNTYFNHFFIFSAGLKFNF